MKVHELIANLHDVDPNGESEVRMYFHRRHGGTTKEVAVVRRFITNGAVIITDELDDEA